MTRCEKNNCSLCQRIIEASCYDSKGKIFYVNHNMSCDVQNVISCDVRNVIYVITCYGCGEYYIGQMGGKLRTGRTIHAQHIRDPSTRIPLSVHLDTCCQTEPKFQIFPFYKLNSESISARLTKESYFIKCFKPKLNAV